MDQEEDSKSINNDDLFKLNQIKKSRIKDGEEVYHEPKREEIEAKVRVKLQNESYYMDEIIEEYVNLNHINHRFEQDQISDSK